MSFPPPPLPVQHHQSNQHNRRLADLPPIWKNKLEHGIHLRLYKNGDQNYPGKEVTLNRRQFRTFESWLSDLSNSMRLRNGAIWRVYTPTHGTRKADFDDFEDGQMLVVAGQERFKPLRYDQITSSENKKSPPFKYDADPVIHNRKLQHSGKISKIDTKSKLIKVWPNGDDLRGPRRVLLSPRIYPYNLPNIIAHVNEIMKGDCLGTVEKLFFLNGIKVSDIDQITHNGLFVACRRTERFKKCCYNEFSTKNLSTSPRLERKFLPSLNSKANSSSQSSPEHSNASTYNSMNGHPPRRRAVRKEEDQVFPARPVKHTRSSEKNRAVDLDKDQGGMFKAKQNNRTTHGAREVQETRHTRTELPVDQRQAKTVEDEALEMQESQTRNSRTDEEEVGVVTRASHAPAYRRHDEKIIKGKKTAPRNGPDPTAGGGGGGGGVEARANSKRSPPAGQKKQNLTPQHDDMERQKSAAKIQAGYRGYKTRKELKSNKKQRSPTPVSKTPDKQEDDYNNNDDYEEERHRAAAKIQAGVRGHQSRNRSRETEKEPQRELQQEDTLLGEEELAAAKIQAGFRGFKTRQKLQREKFEALEKDRREEEEKAATKIQAGYRGYSSRKTTRLSNATRDGLADDGDDTHYVEATKQDEQDLAQVSAGREDSYDSLDREIQAATKIQSSYRGYVARKEYAGKREAAVNLKNSYDDDDNNVNSNDRNNPIQLSSSPKPVTPPKENQSQVIDNTHPTSSPTLIFNEEAVDRYRSSRNEEDQSRSDLDNKTPTEQQSEEQAGNVAGEDESYHELPEQDATAGVEKSNTPPQDTHLSPGLQDQETGHENQGSSDVDQNKSRRGHENQGSSDVDQNKSSRGHENQGSSDVDQNKSSSPGKEVDSSEAYDADGYGRQNNLADV
ncbi:doublecortin domain-containing protein 2 [Plakobranchus ocellatus]|uniref:Doublecortin domain-containing protein 2 n=1 Tax=Plakobranchus ocellatus TaxID=259542 RepID=A0AAV4D0B0_9GAST|nr:doublecortin domain-containing protein 2 [Plakobranchus ocellatus]